MMSEQDTQNAQVHLKIAIPIAGGLLCAHFGHCEEFAFYEVDRSTGRIVDQQRLIAPPHQPGLLPRWLQGQTVNLVLAGGMGSRAQTALTQFGIEVVTGVSNEDPERIVDAYMDGRLQTGANVCDH